MQITSATSQTLSGEASLRRAAPSASEPLAAGVTGQAALVTRGQARRASSGAMRTYVRCGGATLVPTPSSGPVCPGYRDEAVVRHFDAPEAISTRFYEVRAKSILNRVPEASQMPFRWTINPYRGCTHACNFCFARPTHKYLDFDAGRDFEREIVVKVNAPERLRVELARPSWKGEHIALGTNTDPYQWVEGRYKLMPGSGRR